MAALTLAACPPQAVLNTEPAVTSKGEASGTAMTATIGASGGTLRSGDGKLELIIPAGALASDTMFTATPLTTKAPGALFAYRLGPEGTTFSSPVSIRFTASSADLAGSEPAALRIAYQDEQGRWRAFDDGVVDGNAITVKSKHLSDWSALLGWQLRPGTASVALGATQTLTVRYCNTKTYDEGTEGELVSLVADCQEEGEELAPLLGAWSVNGTAGGNASVGTVAPGSPSATYTAPSSQPPSNPVAVSVEFNPPAKKKTLLVSNLTVGSSLPRSYSGTFQYSRRIGGPGTNVAFEEISGMGEVTYEPWPEMGPYKYKVKSGSFTLSRYAADKANCDCTASSGSGTLSGSLTVKPDNTLHLGWNAGTFTVALTCSKRTPTATCVNSDTLGPSWSLTTLAGGCTGSFDERYNTVTALNGSWTQSCPTSNSLEESSWSLTAGP